MEKRNLSIAPSDHEVHESAQSHGQSVFCGVTDIAPGTITVSAADGALHVLQLSDFDQVDFHSEGSDETIGWQRHREIVKHLAKHGVRSICVMTFYGDPCFWQLAGSKLAADTNALMRRMLTLEGYEPPIKRASQAGD